MSRNFDSIEEYKVHKMQKHEEMLQKQAVGIGQKTVPPIYLFTSVKRPLHISGETSSLT